MFKQCDMDKIRRLLLVLVADVFVMVISWACLSLIVSCMRVFLGQQVALIRMLSVSSFFAVMFFFAFYLVLDFCEYFSTEIRLRK
jgi:hypothetical protein